MTDYLIKRGYTRTEEAFRKEIAGGNAKAEEEENKRLKPDKYVAAFEHLLKWVDNSLDLYKVSHLFRRPMIFADPSTVRAGKGPLARLCLLVP